MNLKCVFHVSPASVRTEARQEPMRPRMPSLLDLDVTWVDEPPPRGTQYVRGDVAMAKTQLQPSGSSGSQFFIVTTANATQSNGLTPVHALLGKVVSGMDVVQRIDSLPTTPPGDGKPTPPVVMSRVTVNVS